MSTQIDYQDFIDELKDEVGTGSLSNNETIQILRAQEADKNGYYPIVDWYYNQEAMSIELETSDTDDDEDLEETKQLQQQYRKDQPHLEEMTVEACLAEMFSKTPKKEKRGKGKGKGKKGNPFF